MRRSKKKQQASHACRRFSQRYGVHFSREQLLELVRQIQNNDNAIHIEKQSNRVSVWDVTYRDGTYRVVYDKMRQQIVTVLPEKARQESA